MRPLRRRGGGAAARPGAGPRPAPAACSNRTDHGLPGHSLERLLESAVGAGSLAHDSYARIVACGEADYQRVWPENCRQSGHSQLTRRASARLRARTSLPRPPAESLPSTSAAVGVGASVRRRSARSGRFFLTRPAADGWRGGGVDRAGADASRRRRRRPVGRPSGPAAATDSRSSSRVRRTTAISSSTWACGLPRSRALVVGQHVQPGEDRVEAQSPAACRRSASCSAGRARGRSRASAPAQLHEHQVAPVVDQLVEQLAELQAPVGAPRRAGRGACFGVAGEDGGGQAGDAVVAGGAEQRRGPARRSAGSPPNASSWSSSDWASRIDPPARRAISCRASSSACMPSLGDDRACSCSTICGRADAGEVEPLAARQDRDRDLLHLGRGEDELDVRRRLLERLQQGVERRRR